MKELLDNVKAALLVVLVLVKDEVARLVVSVRKAVAAALRKVEELIAPKV